ncbi:MAG: M56 family metallopeptidase [Bacteroidota bacterium]
MITYIIKSGLCLALILLVYKVLLERERMYVFNRYYLLFGLCFAFAVPFITMETTAEIPFIQDTTVSNLQNLDLAALQVNIAEHKQETTAIPTWILAIMSVYAIGYLLYFFRFIRNIYKIFYKIITGVRVRYKVASLVLLKENVLPHTFLHYIFLRKEAYDTHNIAEELYTHELAHVSQKHTLDIILIELIQIVFWFNPLLMYYKKAIQLNHEFLADDAVLKSNTQVPTYQQLLLANAHGSHNLHLASNLNFSVTKKRLQMMTKHTTRGRAWLVASLTIPIFTAAIFLFSTKVIAQKTVTNNVATSATTINFQKEQDPKAEYYKNATFVFEDAQGNKTEKNYSELTATEKARLIPPPPKPTANAPTATQLNNWKNKTKFAVWVDGKVIDNKEIVNHKIVHYTQSFVYKNARSKRFPQSYQVHMHTAASFKAMQNSHKTTLSNNAVLYFKEGSDMIQLGKKKVGAVNEQTELQKAPFYATDTAKGPMAGIIPYNDTPKKKTQRQNDITILINKEEKFLVNGNYVVPDLKKLDKLIKSELAKIKHKKTRTASIVSDPTVSKDFVLKTLTLLKDNNIYDITLKTSNKDDEIRLPPPPPAPPKPQIKEITVPPPPPPAPVPSDGELKDLEIMHKIMRGGKMETMMINGKKYYAVEKNGRKYIFNENAKLVDKNGKELPPPPPRAKKKAKIKEVKVKEIKIKEKNKAKAKNKDKQKNKAKAKEKNKEKASAEKVKVIEVKEKLREQKQ